MKKVITIFALLILTFYAQAQLKTPAPSPGQTIKQDFGLSNIELSYSRPGMKGRKIFGDLVPYDKVWRTGANAATTLTFGDEVIIGGTKISAGKYGLLSMPGKTSWTIIISRQTNVTSPSAYKPEEDVVRVVVKPITNSSIVELFTMQFANVRPESCELQIMWDKTIVALPIQTKIEDRIMASIENSMKSDKPAYFQAALYYLENGKDLTQASAWFAKAVEAQPDAYWVRYQQARTFAKLGKRTEAKQAALKSIELAKTAKNDDYVKLNEKLLNDIK